MATGKSLSELERTWFADRTTSSNKIADMKREYYGSKIGRAGDPVNISVEELERRWLQSVSLTSTNMVDQLWIEVLAAQGVPAGENTDERKRNFYSTVTTSP